MTSAPRCASSPFIRSCVIGLGVSTFSIWSAIALASKIPTQMGSRVSLVVSCRTTMGELVSGSIIRPLILNSISFMNSSGGWPLLDPAAAQAVGRKARDLDRDEAPHQILGAIEVDDFVARGSPGEPEARPGPLLHQDLHGPTEVSGVAVVLDEFLVLLQDA